MPRRLPFNSITKQYQSRTGGSNATGVMLGQVSPFVVNAPVSNPSESTLGPLDPIVGQAFNKIEEAIKSEETKKKLQSAVETLGTSAANIEKYFRNVAWSLDKGLEAATTNDQTLKAKERQEDWSGHHKKYVDLLWESRRIAGSARVVANDFSGDFLNVIKDDEYSVSDKKEEIETSIKLLERDNVQSIDLSRNIDELQSKVAAYLRKYSGKVEEQDIERLVVELASFSALIKCTIWSAVFSLGLGTAAIGLLAIEIEPVASSFTDIDRKLREESKRLDIILANLERDLKFIQESFEISPADWRSVRVDSVGIKSDLERITQTNSDYRSYFEKKIGVVVAIFKVLESVLYTYETNVHVQE